MWSAYHLCMDKKRAKWGRPESSSTVANHQGWLALRGSNAPGKAKMHTSRLMKNGLAVGVELMRRSIKAGVFCPACEPEETVYHRFWACSHAAKFWKVLSSELGAAVAIPPISVSSQSSLRNWLLQWFAEASEGERSVLIQGLYAVASQERNT